MTDRKILYTLLIIVLIIVIPFIFMYTWLNLETNVPTGNYVSTEFSIKPSEYSLPPGDMIAVLLSVKNNDKGGRDLYYNFNFKAIQTDTGTSLEEINKWVLFNEDHVFVTLNEVGFKDAVVSIPSHAPEGEYVFHAYACYAETPEELVECGRDSSNLWAEPLTLTIRVTD